MYSNVTFTFAIISQWLLFIGIALVLFGWVEKKNKFIFTAQFLFILIGLFAAYLIVTSKANTPESTDFQLTKELKILAYFKSLAYFSILGITSLLVSFFKLRFQKTIIVILILAALMLFFMVFNILQTPA